MAPFLTVKDAATHTGKSPSSIRRIIYPIIQDDNHPDRKYIQPDIDETKKLRVSGETFAWKINADFLDRAVPSGASNEKGSPASRPAQSTDATLIAMLQRELEIKNQQIDKQSELLSRQMQLIDGLGERLREGNILIGALQRQLALPEAPVRSNVVDSRPPTAAEGDTSPKKSPKPPSKQAKPKRGFFRRLFS